MSFAHWPQWLVLSSLLMRLVMVVVGTISGQSFVRVPLIVIVIYTVFLFWCMLAGGFFKDLWL